jgi:hypothetical protein
VEGFEFVAGVKDEMSGPAKAAKASLAAMKDELKLVDASLKSLKDAQRRFKAEGLKDEAKASGDAIAKMKDKAGGLKEGIKDTTAGLKDMTESTGEAKGGMLEAGAAGGAMAAGISIGVEVLKKIGEAAMWAAEKLVHFAIEGAKVAIEAGAMKEKMVALYDLFGAGKGEEIFAKIDKLGSALHIPTEKAHEYAKDLIQSGIEGQNRLEQTVKSVALLAKVGGDDAANKMKGILEETAKTQKTMAWKGGRGMFAVTREQLVGTGVTIDQVYGALAKRMKLNIGQVRQMMMMGQITAAEGIDALNDVIERGGIGEKGREMVGDLTQVFTEIKDNIGKILRDVDYKGFVKEMQSFAGLFDPANASGKATQKILVNAFNTIFSVAKTTVHYLKIAILDMEIAGLKLLILLAPQIKQFKKLWAEMKTNTATTTALNIAWNMLVGAGVMLAYSIKGVMVMINGAMVLWNALGDAMQYVTDTGAAIAKMFGGLDMKSLGLDIIKGLVVGITGGQSLVVDALSGVAKDALKATKDTLGIASPSKEMQKLGRHTAEGFDKGVEQGGGAGGAFAKGKPPALGPAPSGGINVTVNADISIDGAQSPKDVIDEFRARMTDTFEQIAETLRGVPA